MPADARRKRLLVVKLADLGDVLLCEPALRSLRAGYPDARIDLLVPPSSRAIADMLDGDITVRTFPKQVFDAPRAALRPDRLVTALRFAFSLRRERYDAVVMLHHLTTAAGAVKFRALAAATGSRKVVGLDNGRGDFLTHRVTDLGFGRIHDAEYMLHVALAAGGGPVDAMPRLPAPESDIPFELREPYVAIFPATGAYSKAREWSANRFADLAAMLDDRGITPVIVGGTDATEAAELIVERAPAAIDLTGRTDPRALFAVLAGAAAAVGGDTFIGHASAALGTPVVSIFGPSNRHAWRPYGSVDVGTDVSESTTGIVVYHGLPCEPCIYTGFSLGRPRGCPARTCLDRIEVHDVLAALVRVMEVS